jgi:hypothetical protein
MIRCTSGHWFNAPIESHNWDREQEAQAGTNAAASRNRGHGPHRPP